MDENNTKLGSSEDKPSQLSTCFAVVLILSSVVNITSNVLVLVILARNNRLRTLTNFFIGNLCVVDLIAGFVLIPLAIDSLLAQPEPLVRIEFSSTVICKFYGFLNSLYGIATSLTVAVIALDRYHSILNCLRYEIIVTQRRAGFVIACTWMLAFFISLCPLVGWGHFSLNPYQRCSLYFPDKSGFIFFRAVICVLVPYFITVFCYTRIHLVARRHARTIINIQVRDTRNKLKGVNLSISKKTIRVYVVLGVYTTCWIPFYAINLLITICPGAKIPEQLMLTTAALTLVNSACNPIMYALITSQFRNGLKRVYRRICRSIFADDRRQVNPTGPRGESRSSWTFTRSSAKRFFSSQEPVRPKLVFDLNPVCAVIREESSMNARSLDRSNQVCDMSAYPLTLQVPDEKWHKSREVVKGFKEGCVKKNGWVGD